MKSERCTGKQPPAQAIVRSGDFSRPCSGVAKTNPYNQRQSAALAFDEEQADEYPRPRTSARTADDAYRGQPRAGGDRAEGGGAPRGRRRAPIRQSRWADFRWSRFLFRTRIGFALLCVCLIAGAVVLVLGYRQVRGFAEGDPHFRIASSGSIQIAGAADADQGGLTRADLLSVFASDIGRNIFFVPLRKRQAQLEQLPWVAHATVMRLLPDHLSVSLVERVPIAFVRLGSRIGLVDADGVLLSLPPSTLAGRHYSFPVVAGLAPTDAPQARADRMQLYQRFVAELDSSGQPVSSQLSEVDLSDLEDIRAVVPAQGSDILLHFGDSEFLTRYRSYQAHLAEWRQQYPHLSAIDLRYDRQVVLKMADGAESEASSVDHGNSLTAAPPTAHPAHPAHHPAGHGSAHGWRPR
jgi:cell division protein FtsQ